MKPPIVPPLDRATVVTLTELVVPEPPPIEITKLVDEEYIILQAPSGDTIRIKRGDKIDVGNLQYSSAPDPAAGGTKYTYTFDNRQVAIIRLGIVPEDSSIGATDSTGPMVGKEADPHVPVGANGKIQYFRDGRIHGHINKTTRPNAHVLLVGLSWIGRYAPAQDPAAGVGR